MTTGAPPADSAFWLFFGALTFFSLFWVFTLVPFVLALSFRPRPGHGAPRPIAEVRAALAALGRTGRPWRLTPLSDESFKVDWDVVDASWYERFAKVKLSVVYRMRLYLQESTHEVRTYESLRSGGRFLGFDGWRARFSWSWTYRGGALNIVWSGMAYGITRGFPPRIGQVYRFTLDTAETKREIEAAANGVGWTLYPTTLPFEVSPWAVRLGNRLTPAPMRGWSRRKFWGVLHALSWAGILACMLAFVPWTPHNVMVMLLVFGGILVGSALVVGAWRAIDRLSLRRTRRPAGRASD